MGLDWGCRTPFGRSELHIIEALLFLFKSISASFLGARNGGMGRTHRPIISFFFIYAGYECHIMVVYCKSRSCNAGFECYTA